MRSGCLDHVQATRLKVQGRGTRFQTPRSPGQVMVNPRRRTSGHDLLSGEYMPIKFRILPTVVALLLGTASAQADAWDYRLFTPDFTEIPPGPEHDRIAALREKLLAANNRNDAPAALDYAQQILKLSRLD